MNRFRTVDLRKSQIYGGRHCNLCVYHGYKYTILSGCRYDVFVSPIINNNNKYTLLLFIYIMTLTWGVKVFVIHWHIINVTLVNSWIVGFSIKKYPDVWRTLSTLDPASKGNVVGMIRQMKTAFWILSM